MRTVDLRSDTVTSPTPEMRKAMAEAKTGDDVFGEDPTVRRLEEKAAELTGKENALFVASGTMANLVCQLTHCGRGDEMILGDQSHIFYYEQGGSSALAGVHPRTVPNLPDGRIPIESIELAIRPKDIHFPKTRLIVLENTHNRCSGSPIPPDYMEKAGTLAQKHGVSVHIDGARIFNAAAALEVDVKKLTGPADSVSFCLSKGLAAPVGSLVCGSDSFIEGAVRQRKILGGGMRQAGVIAAAGLVALTEMVGRLADDHANCRRLAEGFANIPGLSVNLDLVKTNILFFDPIKENLPADVLVNALADNGVRMLALGPKTIRAVTHYHIQPDDIDYVLNVMNRLLSK